MESNAVTCAQAANRDVSDAAPGAAQDCSTVVHIAVFFDGTGNNRDEDGATQKWSNVARMYDSARTDEAAGIFRIYVSGVGTKFNGTAANWVDSGHVWVQDNLQGMGFGGGGDRRMDSGADNVNQRLRDVLLANARQAGGKLKAYADKSEAKSFEEVNNALGAHRLIKMINLSVFGFSRGAALARAFSNRILGKCKTEAGELVYQEHYPLRLNFMGLFDTVASFGAPAQNVSLPWSERDLIVSPKIERCVHLLAGHEIRYSFPVDLIRKNGQLAGNFVEKVYPGVHSDVGGGYETQAQKIDNNYARIPMRDMMKDGVESGVRMASYSALSADPMLKGLFQERFECRPETLKAYSSYMNAYGGAGGPVESQMQRHMKLLYSAYGTMFRSGIETPGDRQRGESTFKSLGPKGMAWEVKNYERAVKLGRWVRLSDTKNLYAQYVKPEDWQMEAWKATATEGATAFVRKYVHDSKVDFVGNIEPFSYFCERGVAESTRSIWREGGAWIGSKARQAGDTLEAGAEVVQKKAAETYDSVSQRAEQAYDAGKAKATATYDAASRKAAQAYDATKAQATSAYESTRTTVTRGIDSAKTEINEAGQEAKRIVESGTDWVEQTASDLAKKAKALLPNW